MKKSFCRHSEFVIAGRYAPKDPGGVLDDLVLQVKDDQGRLQFEFLIEEHDFGAHPTLRVGVFSDAFAAFTVCPELFTTLAGRPAQELDQVQEWLVANGWTNELHEKAEGGKQ